MSAIRKYILETFQDTGAYYRGSPHSPFALDYNRSYDDKADNQSAGGMTPWKEPTKKKVRQQVIRQTPRTYPGDQ